jgi:hypothetical protein
MGGNRTSRAFPQANGTVPKSGSLGVSNHHREFPAMRTKVDSVAIAGIVPLQQSALHHRGKPVAAVLAALLLSACSSKNPDSLIGMNVDENLAMTDANEMSNADLTDRNTSGARDSAAADSHSSNQSARAAKKSLPQASGGSSAEVNADDAVATNPRDRR